LVWCLLLTAACISKKRTVIAENEEWTITAVGGLNTADVEITFEAQRRGAPYASGHLHFNSDSFDEEYPIRAWASVVAPNALRIGAVALQQAADHILLRNEATSAIKWLRVGSFEFFLVFDLSPGASIRLPCARWCGAYGFGAEGQFQDGRDIPPKHSVQADEPPRPVVVIVTDSGAGVSIQPG
jgi:hypothetical protein